VHRPAVDPEVTRRWRERLAAAATLTVQEGFGLLADYGVPVVPILPAVDLTGAIAAASQIGWPVVLKTAAGGIAHKSDVGAVRLGIADEDMLTEAYGELSRSLGPQVTVSAVVPRGAELAMGLVRDPQFGPLIMIGAGGVLVEVLSDRAFAEPPLDLARAKALLGRLQARRLLAGFRGVPACNVEAVAEAIVRFSALAADIGDLISELDVNPLIAGPSSCTAVDVLVSRS
jgi:hypothetical protein